LALEVLNTYTQDNAVPGFVLSRFEA